MPKRMRGLRTRYLIHDWRLRINVARTGRLRAVFPSLLVLLLIAFESAAAEGTSSQTGRGKEPFEIRIQRIGVTTTHEFSTNQTKDRQETLPPQRIYTSVQEIRGLSPEEAANNHPVQLRGVVTYYDREWNILFIQDATAGIFVDPTGQE